ncbi:hypothetical protein WJX73_008511 [Symbiochloris irregularis]|uniref:Protein kinase domain-containing protein n=1 Tax=Symbiochloris irregularis TaxID=706552 RepID=A0AAW1PZS0_9CHLO
MATVVGAASLGLNAVFAFGNHKKKCKMKKLLRLLDAREQVNVQLKAALDISQAQSKQSLRDDNRSLRLEVIDLQKTVAYQADQLRHTQQADRQQKVQMSDLTRKLDSECAEKRGIEAAFSRLQAHASTQYLNLHLAREQCGGELIRANDRLSRAAADGEPMKIYAGDCEVTGYLGKGRFGAVSKVKVQATNILRGQFAMKGVWGHYETGVDPEYQKALLSNEWKAMDWLRHANIIAAPAKVIAKRPAAAREHSFGFLLELMESDLESAIITANRKVQPWVTINLMEQLAAGVRHAHEHYVLHRDIKCNNLLLDGPLPQSPSDRVPTLKVADWGLSRAYLRITQGVR